MIKEQTYKPDLSRHLSQCEANYARFMRLFPAMRDMQAEERFEFHVHRYGDVSKPVVITVKERGPYTNLLDIREQSAVHPSLDLHMQVRVYHDAQLAEVVQMQRKRVLESRYKIPNKQMYQSDEKSQCNVLIGECLRDWNERGFSSVKMCNITSF